jgi:drug/metabolite transporter (DMT)-like permease
MSPLAILVWGIDLVFDTTGHLALKQATRRADRAGGRFWRAMAADPVLWLALAAFAGEFAAWLSLIALLPLSQAVLLGCVNILGVMLGGRLVFGERITAPRVAAIGMIGIGVALVGWGAP